MFVDSTQALYVSERLDAGTVFVNTYNKTDVAAPFGGFKQSGFGKDLGESLVFTLWFCSYMYLLMNMTAYILLSRLQACNKQSLPVFYYTVGKGLS